MSYATDINGNGSKKRLFLNLWYSLFADKFTLKNLFLNSPMRCILSIDVILLNERYIWFGLNHFWSCKWKFITPSFKLGTCTLWTVHGYESANGNWEVVNVCQWVVVIYFVFWYQMVSDNSWLVPNYFEMSENLPTWLLILLFRFSQ